MKLIVQPDAGIVPVVQAIRKARTLHRHLHLPPRPRGDRAGARRGGAARRARARADRRTRTAAARRALRKLEQRLLAAGVMVTRTADDLLRYHGKFMVADDTLHVFGFNFTKLDIDKSRSFAIATRDRRTVKEALEAVRGRLHPADLRSVPLEPRGQPGDGARPCWRSSSRARDGRWRSTTSRSRTPA